MRCLRFLPVLMLSSTVLLVACLDQYNPQRYYAQWNKEYAQSKVVAPKLTAAGEIPQPGGQVVNADELYATYCATCHGANGGGDGPGGVALSPKPRNFQEQAWQSATDDQRIDNVIRNGGGPNGLSAAMPPWGSTLSDAQIAALVKKVREFAKQ